MKCFLPEILNALLDRGAASPPPERFILRISTEPKIQFKIIFNPGEFWDMLLVNLKIVPSSKQSDHDDQFRANFFPYLFQYKRDDEG
ncbi:MAG: hypothetical protein PHQ81_08715 [Methanofollis sp.]|nr:hypothetical protein [Methanofollis sp.]